MSLRNACKRISSHAIHIVILWLFGRKSFQLQAAMSCCNNYYNYVAGILKVWLVCGDRVCTVNRLGNIDIINQSATSLHLTTTRQCWQVPATQYLQAVIYLTSCFRSKRVLHITLNLHYVIKRYQIAPWQGRKLPCFADVSAIVTSHYHAVFVIPPPS